MTERIVKVKDIIDTLDKITGGRVVKGREDLFCGKNPFVVVKSSNIPGKAVMEIPGIVWGDLNKPVRKLAVAMTLTECKIELAGATGVDVIVAHHPIADAANSGGVTLKNYLGLYNIAAIELHEAFHGLHPGISYIHGIKAHRVDIAYGGIPGNIMYVGTTLEGIETLGDILNRLREFMNYEVEEEMLESEREVRGCREILETNIVTGGKIFNGSIDSRVKNVLHIFPHTGFTPEHLEQVMKEHPEVDTVLATISRVHEDSPLVLKAQEYGLNFIAGNSHAMEIYENGLPLAAALNYYLGRDVKILIFNERVTSTPVEMFGSKAVREYAKYITENFLIEKGK
jgi:hypothetical protein